MSIYDLFLKTDLIKVTPWISNLLQSPVKSKLPPSQEFTPSTKHLIASIPTPDKKRFIEELYKDDIIDTSNKDPDYQEKMENNELGFYMEDFISCYGLCPICGKNTLCTYVRSNIPVVDLVCINKLAHPQECCLFQVKISLTNFYFDSDKISVGSRTYGDIAHLVKANASLAEKIIVPGYICIKLTRKHDQIYSIDDKNSFVLIPDYKKQSANTYYQYKNEPDKYGKPQITWDKSIVKISRIASVISRATIDYQLFKADIIANPYKHYITQK